METKTKNKIELFLRSLNIDNLEIMDYVNIDNIDLNNPFYSIYAVIEENEGFYIEIIYYTNAIGFLNIYDISLKQSLNLASQQGYQIENINSELLATLLATEKTREDFYSKQTEIEKFFNSL